MAPLVPRLLAMTYGSVSVGGSTAIDIDGPIRIIQAPDTVQVSATLIATAASSSAAAALWATLEAGLAAPHGALTITMDSETVLSLVPTTGTNTGFNARTQLSKDGTPLLDSRLSRHYQWSVTYDRPADRYSSSGRRDSDNTVAYDAARIRTVTVAGEYRALGGNDSYDQYASAIDAFAATIFSRYDLTLANYNLTLEVASTDDRDKIASFQRQYSEIVHNEATGAINSPLISDARLVIQRSQDLAGFTPGGPSVDRPVTLSVTYSARVPRDQTSDLRGTYRSVARPQILNSVRAVYGAAAIVTEVAGVDPTTRTITAQFEMLAYPGKVDLYIRSDSRAVDEGAVIWPVWDPDNDDRDSCYVYAGARIVQHTTTEEWSADPSYLPTPAKPPSAAGGKTWVPLRGNNSPQTLRTADNVARTTTRIVQEWRRVKVYEPPARTIADDNTVLTEGSSSLFGVSEEDM